MPRTALSIQGLAGWVSLNTREYERRHDSNTLQDPTSQVEQEGQASEEDSKCRKFYGKSPNTYANTHGHGHTHTYQLILTTLEHIPYTYKEDW